MDYGKSSSQVGPKILVSACLLGELVRYDGNSKQSLDKTLSLLVRQHRVIAFCPEVAGGLPTPRQAAEIQHDDRVTTDSGTDVTDEFIRGAQLALKLCRLHDIHVAVLTDLSPSCGNTQIDNGLFKRQQIDGEGITTRLLKQHGIQVFNQYQFDHARIVADSYDQV